MKQLKPYLQTHSTAKEAYDRTIKSNVIAVVVRTYQLDTSINKEYYSYKTNNDTKDNFDLYEDFPLTLSSNQSIEEIGQFD